MLLHGGQSSIYLEYQTYTSAHLFDTLVTGMGETPVVQGLYISCLWALDLPQNLFFVSENGSFDVYRQGSNSFIYIVS